MTDESHVRVVRLGVGDSQRARAMFTLLAEVFDESSSELSNEYVRRLLDSAAFWAYAATIDGELVGGLTAHTLMMTTTERAEVFLYDLAVRPSHQRRGVGRSLVDRLVHDSHAAGIDTVFVPADDEDEHALDFYRSLGAPSSPVTIFDLGPSAATQPAGDGVG
jgi:aminoglycoside 3-N-acetyltransferase I